MVFGDWVFEYGRETACVCTRTWHVIEELEWLPAPIVGGWDNMCDKNPSSHVKQNSLSHV